MFYFLDAILSLSLLNQVSKLCNNSVVSCTNVVADLFPVIPLRLLVLLSCFSMISSRYSSLCKSRLMSMKFLNRFGVGLGVSSGSKI